MSFNTSGRKGGMFGLKKKDSSEMTIDERRQEAVNGDLNSDRNRKHLNDFGQAGGRHGQATNQGRSSAGGGGVGEGRYDGVGEEDMAYYQAVRAAQARAAAEGRVPRMHGTGQPAANPFAAINRPGIAANYDFQAQARARQQALIDQLHGIASGKIKSPAMEQFEQQVVQAQNQNMSNAASLRDVGPGGQRQIAAQNAATIQGQGIQSAALLQTQQQATAEQQLARLYEQQRAGDLGEADSRSRGILGNRGLDDNLNQQEFGRMYGLEVDSARRSADRARADLGFDVDQQAQNRSTANAAVQGAGTAFGYMANAMGNGGGANQGTDSLVGGWQDPAASEWKPYTTSSFYDIRDKDGEEAK